MGFLLSIIGLMVLIVVSAIFGFIFTIYVLAVKSEQILNEEEFEDYKRLTKKLFDF